MLRRRILVIGLFAWLRLLVLSVVEGHGWGTDMTLLYEVEAMYDS